MSVLAWQELMTGAALKSSGLEAMLAEALQCFGATKFVPVSQGICERAFSLAKQFGRRVYGYDAIHLATALAYKALAFKQISKQARSTVD